MISINNLRGIVERITYRNIDDGYTILKIRIKGSRELIAVTGYFVSVNIGSVITVYGEWKKDKKYGRQFKAEKYEETLPATIYGIEKYLGSGLINGIGPKYARKIVSYFGRETLEIIEKQPERLLEIEGIGTKLINRIKISWNEQKNIKSLMIFLQKLDLNTFYAPRIYKVYGDDSIKKIKDNPYSLVDDVWGIGFKTADKIAEKLRKDKESYDRCRSGLMYILNKASDKGHCFMEPFELYKRTIENLNIDEGKIFITLDHLTRERELIVYHDGVYLPSIYYSEDGISKLIKKIMQTPEKKKIKKFSLNTTIKYDDIQKRSINCAINSKFMVLTGGPGTGKTTTMSGIIEIFKNNNFNIILTAPTGRAAKRMSEVTNVEAQTIHRLLEAKPPNEYNRNEKNLLKGDVLIVDESSMIDIFLMYNLLKAVPSEMKVILIGDVNQLPSIGAGNLLKDIINSGIVPVVKLEKIYRQAEKSDIIKNAYRVNRGEYINLKQNKKDTDFYFIEEENDKKIVNIISDLCSKRLPKYYNVDCINDIQVLCPMQKGETGTININSILQRILNNNKTLLQYRGQQFKLNDKVMQIKNNYDKEVFNGDVGIIEKVNIKDKTLSVNYIGKIIIYEETELEELSLAYAITIHKSQGCEYKIVVIPITMSNQKILQRNLLYTGITRAKKIVVLIGSPYAVEYAINNNTQLRNTYLCEKLKLTDREQIKIRDLCNEDLCEKKSQK